MTEITFEYWNKLADQIIMISSLLGGFTIAVIANLLVSEVNTRLFKNIMIVSTLTASFFLISVFACLGILFSIMRWPMNAFNEIGLPILIIVGIIGFMKYSTDFNKSLLRILIIGGIGGIIWLTPNDTINDILNVENLNEISVES